MNSSNLILELTLFRTELFLVIVSKLQTNFTWKTKGLGPDCEPKLHMSLMFLSLVIIIANTELDIY